MSVHAFCLVLSNLLTVSMLVEAYSFVNPFLSHLSYFLKTLHLKKLFTFCIFLSSDIPHCWVHTIHRVQKFQSDEVLQKYPAWSPYSRFSPHECFPDLVPSSARRNNTDTGFQVLLRAEYPYFLIPSASFSVYRFMMPRRMLTCITSINGTPTVK